MLGREAVARRQASRAQAYCESALRLEPDNPIAHRELRMLWATRA